MGTEVIDPDLLPQGSSALHCAAMTGDVDALAEILLQGHVFVDAVDRWGRTPLHAALENGRYKAAMFLIQNRANLNLENSDGNSAYNIIHTRPCLCLLEEIVNQQVHININPQELVSVAIDANNFDLLEKVLAYPAVNVNHQDEMGRTALHGAIQHGNIPSVKLLLAHRANVELRDWRDSTPLHYAAKIGNLEAFKLLLDEFVEISEALNSQDHAGCNVLHLLFLSKHYHIITYVMKEFSHFVKYTLANASGMSVEELLYKARDSLGPEVIPCVSTEEAQTLLHEAVYKGDASVLPILVEQGANLNYFDLMQQTPLIAATRMDHLQCVMELLNLGALLSVSDFSGNAPLHYAAQLGRTKIALSMLGTPGAKVTLFNHAQETPLQLALFNHHAETAMVLLEYLEQRSDENWVCCLECCAPWADKNLLDKMKAHLLPRNWLSVLSGEDEYHFSAKLNETLEMPRSTPIIDISGRNKCHYIPLSRCCIVCPWCGRYIRTKRIFIYTNRCSNVERHCYTCSKNSKFYKEWYEKCLSTVYESENRRIYIEHKKMNSRIISKAYQKMNEYTRKEVYKMSLTPTPTRIKTIMKFKNFKKESCNLKLYPMHVAASAGNEAFLNMIFSSIHNLSQKKALLMIEDNTQRRLLDLLASASSLPPISNLLGQHYLLEIVRQQPVVYLTPTNQLLALIESNNIDADHWKLFLKVLEDVGSLPLRSNKLSNDESVFVNFLQKFRELGQACDPRIIFDATVVHQLCKKGLFAALSELIRLWESYTSYDSNHQLLVTAAKSVVFHCLECDDVPIKLFADIMDELITLVGIDHSITLVEHYRYFFVSFRQNMTAVLTLVLKLYDADALNWMLLSKIQSSSRHILLPYVHGLYDASDCDSQSDLVVQIVSSRALCHDLFSSIKHCQKTNNLLLGACAVGSIQLLKLLLPIAPTLCNVKILKMFHFSVTSAAIESHDTELLDAILDAMPASNSEVLLSYTLAYCCRWLGMDLDDGAKIFQRNLYKQRSPSKSVFKKARKGVQVYADCSPFIYSYQTIDALKEAEQARRQILDHLLERDDICTCINSSFSSDSPPPLLVAIQFCWSYGAVQLLLHGADPATHWNNKYALIESIKHKLFTVVECILDKLSDETTESLMKYKEFLPSLVNSFHILASFEQPILLSNIIRHFSLLDYLSLDFNLLDYLWLNMSGAHVISICLYHKLYETAIFLMLNAINYISVMSSGNDEKCCLPLLQLSRHVKYWSRSIEEDEVLKIVDALCQLCTLLSLSASRLTDAFCRACGEGLCEFVNTFLTIVDDSLQSTLLTTCDNYQRSPLFHAACSGSVEMVQILINYGATIETSLTFNHPIIGALAALTTRVHSCVKKPIFMNQYHNNTILYIKQFGTALIIFSISELKRHLPAYTPCEAHLKQQNMVELLNFLVSKSTHEIPFILTGKGRNGGVNSLLVPSEYLFALLANYSEVIKIVENLTAKEFDVPSHEENKPMCNLVHALAKHLSVKCQAETENNCCEIQITNTLDMVLCVLPWSNERTCAFEDFMTSTVKSISPQQSLIAALKGYWVFIEKSIRFFNFRSYNAEQFQLWEHILCCAIITKRIQLARSILSSGMKSAGINANSPTALHLAVKYGHTQLVNALIYKHGYQFLFSSASLCGFKFHCSALDIAAVYGQAEMLTRFLENSNYQCLIDEPTLMYKLVYLSSLFDNLDCLKVLQKVHSTLQVALTDDTLDHLCISTDHLWPNILEADSSTQFWLIVLIGSLSRGHQSICREALSRLFYREDDERFMHYLIDCCCYWGMDVILQDLSLSAKYNFARSEDVVPSFEYSLVGNYFSKLSRFFIGSFESYEKLENIEEIHSIFQSLTVGWFSNLCRLHSLKQLPPMEVAISYQKLFLFKCIDSLEVFCRAVKFNIPTVVQAFLVTLDAAVGTIIRKILKLFNLLHLAAVHSTAECLSLLLNTLSGQSLLEGINSYDTNGSTPLAVAICNSSMACAHLLVRHGSNLKLKNALTKDSLVHMAAISGKVEMLKFLMDLSYFQRHKQELNKENSHGITPLVIALSYGHYEISSLLIKELKMSPLCIKIGKEFYKARGEVKDAYSLGWLLSQALGWFNVLMNHNSSKEDPEDTVVGSLLFNLRSSKDQLGKVVTFCKALKANQESIVQSLMKVSHNTLLLSSNATNVCSRLQLQLLRAHPDVHLKSVKTSLITWLLSHGLDRECAAFIEDHHPSIPPSSVDYQSVFQSCCIHNGLETAKVIMERHLCSTDLVAATGITNCWGSGSFSLATEILLKTDHAPTFANFISSDAILLQAMFDPSFIIHKAFIDSIEQANSVGLPEAILIHEWLENEHLLFMQKIQQQGSCDAIRNCRPSLNITGLPKNVEVDINWSSFDVALQQGNRCPLEIECVVFSSLILSDVLYQLKKSKPPQLNSISLACGGHTETPSVEACPNMTWLKLFVSYDDHLKIVCYPDVDILKLLKLNDTFNRSETKVLSGNLDTIMDVNDGVVQTLHEEKLKPFNFELDAYIPVESLRTEALDALSVYVKCKLMECLAHVRLVNINFDDSVYQNAKGSVSFYEQINGLLEEATKVITHKFKCSSRHCTHCGSHPLHGRYTVVYSLPQYMREITITITVNNDIPQFESSIHCSDNSSINILFQFSQDLVLTTNYSSEFTQAVFNLITELKRTNLKCKVQSQWIDKPTKYLTTLCKTKIPVTLKYIRQAGSDEEDIFSRDGDCLHCHVLVTLLDMLWRGNGVVAKVLCLFKHLCTKPETKCILNYIRNGLNIYIHGDMNVVLLDGRSMGALNIPVADLVRQCLRLTSLASTSLFDIACLKLLPLPITTYIDPKCFNGLLYPVTSMKITFQLLLADITGVHLTSPQSSEFCVAVIIQQPTGRKLASTSQGLDNPQLLEQLTVSKFVNGTCNITWTPAMAGVHRVNITVNGFPTRDSPLTTRVYTVPQKATEYYSRKVNPSFLGSGGYPTTTANKPLVFVVTHPDIPCRPNTCKADVETTKFLSAYVDSSKFEKSFVQRLDERPGIKSNSSNTQKAVNYLTLFYKNGSFKEWKCKAVSSLLLFYQRAHRSPPQCVCTPLGRDTYSVTARFSKSSEFKIFVACSICQAVMHISWLDSASSDVNPTRCFVVPDTMSLKSCTVHASAADFSKKTLPPVGAGARSLFYVVVRDRFGNRVNPDDTVIQSFTIVIKQCGPRLPLHTQAELPPLNLILNASSQDCNCVTKYLNNGVFEVAFTPYCTGSGLFHVSSTGSDTSSQLHNVNLTVKCGRPSAVHSRVQYHRTSVAMNKTYSLKLYLFDKYFNSVQPSKVDFRRWVNIEVLTNSEEANFSIKKVNNYFVIRFVARQLHLTRHYSIVITIDGVNVPQTPLLISVTNYRPTSAHRIEHKLDTLYVSLHCHRKSGLPTQTVERNDILNSALRILSGDNIRYRLRVRFDDEIGMDTGGLSREFFHLLSTELVNPDYVLFECVDGGLYKPNKSSSVNPAHLHYFKLTGTMMAKAICEGHNIGVRFTTSVYKYILSDKCELEDLKEEDATVYSSLIHLLTCGDPDELRELSFTVTSSHFGALQTIELEDGGTMKKVTMDNKNIFVHKMCQWYLTGCIKTQLQSIKEGFQQLIQPHVLTNFSAKELQVVVSGKQRISTAFLKQRITYRVKEETKKWLLEILESFTQQELSDLLLFCTGSSSVPVGESWKLTITATSYSGNLPTASTCSNTLHLPEYKNKETLDIKLRQAISLGQEAFLIP